MNLKIWQLLTPNQQIRIFRHNMLALREINGMRIKRQQELLYKNSTYGIGGK